MAAYASESVSVAGTAVGLTAATFDYAIRAVVTVEAAAIRFWVDGSTPTATAGHSAEIGDSIVLHSSDEIQKFRAIRRDGVTATIRATYEV